VNALAALVVAFELGIDFDTAAAGLHRFTGVGRRFEVKGEAGGVMVIDDYAHHPTELRAVLTAARDYMKASGRKDARLIAAFQPHRYTRTRDLWEEFESAFHEPDVLVMTDIYKAGESPINGARADKLCKAIADQREERGLETHYRPDLAGLCQKLKEVVKPGDLVITLGAGDVWRAGEELIRLLEEGE